MKFKLFRLGGTALAQPRILADALLKDSYSDAKETGFQLEQVSSHVISGRFLEKRIRRFQVFTSEGEDKVAEVESVNFTRFELFPKAKLLLVSDSRASLSALVSRISLASNFRISIVLLPIPIEDLIAFFLTRKLNVIVQELTRGNIAFEDGVQGRVKLRGRMNLESAQEKAFMGLKGVVVSATFYCQSDYEEFTFVWKRTGVFEISPAPKQLDDFVSALHCHVRDPKS